MEEETKKTAVPDTDEFGRLAQKALARRQFAATLLDALGSALCKAADGDTRSPERLANAEQKRLKAQEIRDRRRYLTGGWEFGRRRDPARALIAAEDRRMAADFIGMLPAYIDRPALRLAYAGWTLAEIAALLRLGVGTVHRRLRALQPALALYLHLNGYDGAARALRAGEKSGNLRGTRKMTPAARGK